MTIITERDHAPIEAELWAEVKVGGDPDAARRVAFALEEHQRMLNEAGQPYADICACRRATYSTPGYYMHLAAVVVATLRSEGLIE